MKKETKLNRIKVCLDVMKRRAGAINTLDEWMQSFNEELPGRVAYRNKKQVAQALRYMRCVLKENIIKTQNITSYDQMKSTNICYALM